MKKFKTLFSLFLATVFLISIGCEKDDEKVVDFSAMALEIEQNMTGNSIGFQYTIIEGTEKKEEGVLGNRQLVQGGQNLPYQLATRNSLNSTSKTITAAAMMHALNKFGISVDEKIHSYLPQFWTKHANVTGISFKELLSHTSGLRGTRDDYVSMRNYMASGDFDFKGTIDDGMIGDRYANVNFTLMRILIPLVDPDKNQELIDFYNSIGTTEQYHALLSVHYVQYVQDFIFAPSGISDSAEPLIWDNGDTFNYNFNNIAIGGYPHGDFYHLVGAGGWYLNSEEYARFIARLFNGDLQGIDLELMKNNNLGMYDVTSLGEDNFTHNGSVDDTSGRGARSEWIYFPETEVTIFYMLNSANNPLNNGQIRNLVITAYQNACN